LDLRLKDSFNNLEKAALAGEMQLRKSFRIQNVLFLQLLFRARE